MTRRLALMLAIAVMLLVNVTIGEGGALDNIASGDGSQIAAVSEDPAVEPESDRSRLAVTSTSPWAAGNSSSRSGQAAPVIGTWGEESEVLPPAPPSPAQARQRARSQPRDAGRNSAPTPEEGALERHRMNIEE